MGYYTRYELEVSPSDIFDQVVDEIKDTSGYHNVFEDACEWYDHESDMKTVSALFPEGLLTLRGEGEEAGDLWIKYFQNGKMQVSIAKITYEPFNPSELK